MAQAASNLSSRERALARRRAMSTTGKAGITATTAANNPPAETAMAVSAATHPAAANVSSAVSTAPANSGRAASRARRQAMSTNGKKGIQSKDRSRTAVGTGVSPPFTPAPRQQTDVAEKQGCGCGCNGKKAGDAEQAQAQASTPRPVTKQIMRKGKHQNIRRAAGRVASLARREAMSTRGKAGIGSGAMTSAQTARAANPHLSGRELAQALREQRSRNGKSGQKKSQPSGRMRPAKDSASGAAQDAPWKVGASETAQGQTVTGTMVGRSSSVTGDEPSTCREVTGTEYLGADIFREFCQSDPKASPGKVTVTSTSHGNSVSGNRMGRGSNVTGNEAGTCKRVTGNEYVSADQSQGYCGEFLKKSPRKVSQSQTRKGKAMTGNNVGRSEKVTGDEPGMNRELTGTQYTQSADIGSAPPKVGSSATLRGGNVTGTMVGRGKKTTGDEPGSCRNVTGDDYVGQEQYSACDTRPQPADNKVGVSTTLTGRAVTGTMTGRESKVTGDEPGTCKSVTGTPYAGIEQYKAFCEADDTARVTARKRQQRGTPGAMMTGLQPGVGGTMTGDARGACENVSGTPYVGADQFAQACPAKAADASSPDFPQPMATAPWQQFSVSSPAGEARQETASGSITGSRYEQGQITGPFGMAPGKVTGTEEARFGQGGVTGSGSSNGMANAVSAIPATAETIDGRVKSRITGEGMDAGQKITGDDWDRGDHVTGTEGTSATGRNPTLRQAPGAAMAAAMAPQKRNDEMTIPASKVTGGSGNTEKGALITYSGGARG